MKCQPLPYRSCLHPLPLQGDCTGQRRNPRVRPAVRPPAAERPLLQHGQRCWLGVSPGAGASGLICSGHVPASQEESASLGTQASCILKPKKKTKREKPNPKNQTTPKAAIIRPTSLDLAVKKQERPRSAVHPKLAHPRLCHPHKKHTCSHTPESAGSCSWCSAGRLWQPDSGEIGCRK